MPVSGDFAKLGRLASTLEQLGRLPGRVARRVAPAITAKLQQQFDSGTDPYGKAWEPLKPSTIARKGHDTILVETGEGRDGTKAIALPGAGVGIILGPKLQWHLLKTENRAARPVLPLYGLPKAWRERIEYLTRLEFKGSVRG